MLLSKIMLKDTRSASAMLLSALLYGPAIGPVHVRFRSWELQPLRRSRYYVIGFDRIKTLNAVSRTGRYKTLSFSNHTCSFPACSDVFSLSGCQSLYCCLVQRYILFIAYPEMVQQYCQLSGNRNNRSPLGILASTGCNPHSVLPEITRLT
mgnify:CR=1 FL=1